MNRPPWTEVDQSLFDPDKLTLTPNLLDTTGTRRALARYYTSLAHLDTTIGTCLDCLERTGRAEHTIAIDTSDHGAQFPGGK
jgi:N-sulfoglucosamine sulfohydrolase